MKTIKFAEIKEEVFFEKLENGIDVYLYPTNKSKNFYATFSTRYGSYVTSYKKNGNSIEVYPGTAHFLEHKIMNYTTNKEFFKRINKLGSVANAYTTYNVTNYNIYGGQNIIENLSLLFDMVLKPTITDELVKSEVSIINEEIDMDSDNVNTYLYLRKNRNIFNKLYTINHILGEKDDIKKITSKYLKEIYKDFYTPNNMFIIVVGNFSKDEVIEHIRKYMKKIKNNNDKIIIKKIKEPDKVKINHEIVHREISEDKVYYSLKMNKKVFNDIDKNSILFYLRILLSANFSTTSNNYETYKKENLITGMKTDFKIFDNHLIISIKASTPNSELFIKRIKEDIRKMSIKEDTFNRKKKKILSEVILSFENIEDIEYFITNNILSNKKLFNKEYEMIKNLDFNTIESIIERINFENDSILICTK